MQPKHILLFKKSILCVSVLITYASFWRGLGGRQEGLNNGERLVSATKNRLYSGNDRKSAWTNRNRC